MGSQRTVILVVLAAALVAGAALVLRSGLGGDDQPDPPAPCTAPGDATLSGRVGNRELGPIRSAWYQEFLAGAFVVVLDEGSGSCGDPSRDGRHLVIWLPCGQAAPGRYAVRPREQAQSCDPPFAAVVLEQDAHGDLGTAASGELVVESIAGCVRGRFHVSFPGGSELSGSFAAPLCDSPDR